MKTKICSKCEEEKELKEYYSKMGACKTCRNKQIKEYKEKNKEQIKEKYKERNKKYIKEYQTKHKKQISKNHKKYRDNHKEQIKESGKIYTLNHKEQINEFQKKWDKKQRINLSDKYIISQLRIPTNVLKQYPELIEAKRIHIQIKRIEKQLKL
jgi:hypothetical protein